MDQNEQAVRASEKTAKQFAEGTSRVKTRQRERVTRRCVPGRRCFSGMQKQSSPECRNTSGAVGQASTALSIRVDEAVKRAFSGRVGAD